MKSTLSVATTVRFERERKGTRRLVEGQPKAPQDAPRGRLPRITRLMALAIHFDGLIQSGEVSSYAGLARLGNVTRARITQIMNLLNLAPEIQEAILFLPRVEAGRSPVILKDVQGLAARLDWREQQNAWSLARKL